MTGLKPVTSLSFEEINAEFADLNDGEKYPNLTPTVKNNLINGGEASDETEKRFKELWNFLESSNAEIFPNQKPVSNLTQKERDEELGQLNSELSSEVKNYLRNGGDWSNETEKRYKELLEAFMAGE